MAKPVSTIEQLAPAQLKPIIDRLLANEPITAIAKSTGLSRMGLSRYRAKILRPALSLAKSSVSREVVQESISRSVAQEIAVQSPFRDQLRALSKRLERYIDKAENAVKVVKDADGRERVIDSSLTVLPPFIAQAHRNVELLGRATGELTDKAADNVTVNLVRVLSVPRIGELMDAFPGQLTGRTVDVPAIETAPAPATDSDSDSDSVPQSEDKAK